MSKLKKAGYIGLGIMIGATLTVSVPTLAATAKTIQAKINSSVSVMVDGEKMSAQPINYQNLNYLPVGEIGRALDADVSFDKSKNVINIESKSSTGENGTTSNTGSNSGSVTTPTTETPVQPSIPTVKAGESITANGVTVSLDKIEYIDSNGERIGNKFLPKGFKVFVTITNNSDDPIRLGSTYYYDTGKLLQNKNINSLGNIVFVDVDGKEYLGSTISKGQTAKGFIYSEFNENVKIKSVKYAPSVANITSHDYIGTWTFE